MDEELKHLLARAERFALTGERLSLVFARELAKVWRDTERALARLIREATEGEISKALAATRAVVLKSQVRRTLEREGYDGLIHAAVETSAAELIRSRLSFRTVEQVAAFQTDQARVLQALREIATVDLLAVGDETATALWRSLAQHVLTSRPVFEIMADLADVLDSHEAEVQTLYDTQVSIFGRQVEALATEDLGPQQPFLFVGPIDDVTRPFCLSLVGQVVSRDEIDELDNGQLPNPFLTGGGFNCRHSWLAVESQELRSMADTGERVPEVVANVKRVRERKERKKAA